MINFILEDLVYPDRGDRICMTKLALYGKFSEVWRAGGLEVDAG